MVRTLIEEFSNGDVHGTVEFDSGGPVGADRLVTIAGPRNEASEQGKAWSVDRRFYFDEFGNEAVREFAETVATDDAYRDAVLAGETNWVVTATHYEPAAAEIYSNFQEANVLEDMGGHEDETVNNEAMDQLYSICNDLHTSIQQRVESPEQFDVEDPIDSIINEKQAEAMQWIHTNMHLTRDE